MNNRFQFAAWVLAMLLVCGCATSPEVEERERAVETTIENILSEPLDEAAYGKPLRCLNSSQYRDFRVLDDQRIVFAGSRGRLWLNTLRMRCPDLRHATALRIRSISTVGRICDMDTFQAGDWFDWPWYRRWPWRWGSTWHSGISCSLGTFQPITESQLTAIEAALRNR